MTPRRVRTRLSTLAVVLAMAGALVAAPAFAQTAVPIYHCGMELTASITLEHNLLNCRTHGFVVKAPNITIDLGGFALAGDGRQGGSGIFNEDGFDNITIQNGTLTRFDIGIEFTEENDDEDPVSVVGGAITGIEFIRNRSRGVLVEAGTGILVQDNEILDNSGSIELQGNSNRVIGNKFEKSRNTDARPSVRIRGNLNAIEENDVEGGGDAFDVDGNQNQIRFNDLERPRGFGIDVLGNANVIFKNDLDRVSGRGIHIRNDGDEDEEDCSDPEDDEPEDCYRGRNNHIEKNRVKEGLNDGILVQGEDTRILDNRVKENRGDGIEVTDATHPVIIDNSSKDNRGRGIRANVEGAQGRDNSAKDNRGSPQCSPSRLCD